MRTGTISFLLFAILFLSASPVSAERPSVVDLPSQEFGKRFYRDMTILHSYTDNLSRTAGIIEAETALFNPKRSADFDITEKERVNILWGSFLDHIAALDAMTQYYKDFYLMGNRKNRMNAFLLCYASYIAKFSTSLRLIRKTIDNELYEKRLDDPNPDYGIPAGMYAKLKWNTIHVQDVSLIHAGYQYYRFLLPSYRKQGLLNDERTSWIFRHVDDRYDFIRRDLRLKGGRYFTANGLDILREKTFSAWFPLQMNVSAWMGDTKVRRLNRYFITGDQIEEMQKVLKPGDIIVERRNWYLSNIGLPGFWPHAELYIGTYDEMERYFSEESVTAYYRRKGDYRGFMDYLKKKYPEKMKEFLTRAHDGQPHRIIEAVSEGVKFSSLEEGASADYIGVMRPRLSRLDIAKAIDEAFGYLGRPYDFNFDFLTDSSIVCSELIYKAYQGGRDKEGLDLRLREIAGRKAMPANDIVEKFDREYGTPRAELDFVYFLDGSEKEARAAPKSLSEFRLSHRRLKWDIAQD